MKEAKECSLQEVLKVKAFTQLICLSVCLSVWLKKLIDKLIFQEYEIFTRDYGNTQPTELAGQIMSLVMEAAMKNIFIYLKAIEEPGK